MMTLHTCTSQAWCQRCEYTPGDKTILPRATSWRIPNAQAWTSESERASEGGAGAAKERWREKKVVLECFKFMSAAATVVRSFLPSLALGGGGGGGGRKSHIEPPTRYMNLTASTPVSWTSRMGDRSASACRGASCGPRFGLRPFGSGE